MSITKIIAIKNVGRLKNSAAGGNTTFAKHTFIYGANGFGKTTLCAILRSLKSGDGAYVIGRKTLGAATDPTVDILGAGINYRFASGSWSGLNANLAIYDGIFIAENVHSGDFVDTDQRRNLYRVIVGDAGVSLANEETRLATEARAKTGEITAALRTVQSHAPSGMRVDAFMAMPSIADIDGEIARQEGRLTTMREAAAIGARVALAPLTPPSVPESLTSLLTTTLDGISRDAEQRVTTHLAAHGMADGAGWVLRGLDHTDRTCPFCVVKAWKDRRSSRPIARYLANATGNCGAISKRCTTASRSRLVKTRWPDSRRRPRSMKAPLNIGRGIALWTYRRLAFQALSARP